MMEKTTDDTDDIKLLFDEAKAKIDISKEVANRYGPQAGITMYEVLVNLDEVPIVKMEDNRILLISNGVSFPMWGECVRTINPNTLRNPSNCSEIRKVVNSALYCFNPPPKQQPTYSSKSTYSSALRVFNMLNDIAIPTS
jgi:hypothetical protein